MNILHHKSWHVRTKKNIERVRKDEEKAADEEKEKQRKIALAEQEARTDILRSRAKDKLTDGKETERISSVSSSSQVIHVAAATTLDKPSNINFFKELEDGLRKQGINEEHAKEKKAEKEKWEKSIGLLTYLGKSNIEEQNDTPWYVTGSNRKRKLEDEDEEEHNKRSKTEGSESKEERKRADLDPLNKMKEFVDKKKKKKKHKSDKEKKHKHKERESKHDKKLPKPSTGKTIEQLRAERLKRENKEKQKAMQLFSNLKGGNSKDSDSEEEEEVPERSRKYNSQYNPELSRKYKKRSYDSHD